MRCKYTKAYIGRCENEAIEGEDYCEEHLDLECSSCGEQATHECTETFGLVCGAPLCDDCEHKIFEDGTNGARYSHVKKEEQVHEHWMVEK